MVIPHPTPRLPRGMRSNLVTPSGLTWALNEQPLVCHAEIFWRSPDHQSTAILAFTILDLTPILAAVHLGTAAVACDEVGVSSLSSAPSEPV